MRVRTYLPLLVPALTVLLLTVAATGCGRERGESSASDGGSGSAGGELSGSIEIDGSSTVGPLTTAAAERFREEYPGVDVRVGVSGTGGGFERFCQGETDISNASRPIKDDESTEGPACEKKGIEYTEIQVATDALTVVVNPQNDWAECLTVEQLNAIWGPDSNIDNWSQVPGGGYPDEPLTLSGPGTDSGTFDYFTDEVNGEEGASRSDYQASEDDNVIVQAVSGDQGAMGYFGFSYYDENADKLKALEIDDGDGCVPPSVETAQSGEYTPLARPLYIYVKNDALRKEHIQEFLTFYLENAVEIAQDALYVPLTDEQRREALSKLEEAAGS